MESESPPPDLPEKFFPAEPSAVMRIEQSPIDRIATLEKNFARLEESDRRQAKHIRGIRIVLTLCVMTLAMATYLQTKELSSEDRDTLNKQITGLITTALIGCSGVIIAESQRESKS